VISYCKRIIKKTFTLALSYLSLTSKSGSGGDSFSSVFNHDSSLFESPKKEGYIFTSLCTFVNNMILGSFCNTVRMIKNRIMVRASVKTIFCAMFLRTSYSHYQFTVSCKYNIMSINHQHSIHFAFSFCKSKYIVNLIKLQVHFKTRHKMNPMFASEILHIIYNYETFIHFIKTKNHQ